jgi:hypothetical protein
MLQNIIVLVIIYLAAVIATYRLIRFFFFPFSKCDECAMNCSGCSLDDLKKEIGQKKKSGAALHNGKC